VIVRARIFFPALLLLALVPAVGRATGIDADEYEPFELSIHLHVDRSITSRGMLIAYDHDLGRALGRVLAHEIGHVLLAAPNHANAGLMRAAFRADELAALDRAPFCLTCIGVSRLENRIRSMSGSEPQAIDRRTCVPGHIVP